MFFFLLRDGLFPCVSVPLGNLRNLKVKMIVAAAPGIEVRTTNRAARITLHVLQNRQRCAAPAAKNGLLVPFAHRPNGYRMIGQRLMTILAGIVQAATFHLYGDDVSRPVIMLAAGL